MKKIFFLLAAACALVACDPVQEDIANDGHITLDELVAKTTVTVDKAASGQNGNVITCSTAAPVNAKWDIGGKEFIGNFAKKKMKLGEYNVVLTAICADGTELTSQFPVSCQEITDPLQKFMIWEGEFSVGGWDAAPLRFSSSEGQNFPTLSDDMFPVLVIAQSQKITGTVVDEFGDPVIGANVRVKGTTIGAVTDIDGKFSLDTSAGSELEVSFIGYVSESVKAAPGMTVTLREDSQSLEDVVVIGYGTMKKKLLTGATVQVKGDDISKLNTTNALEAMQSQTPGVQITQSSSQPGKGYKVYIRGIGTTGDAAPLYVIDGVAGGNLDGINPNDIESIDILKDAASAAIYGARAANGVILVTTKQGKAGKIELSYNGAMGWSNAYKRPQLLNAQQYMTIFDELKYLLFVTIETTGKVISRPRNRYDCVVERGER